MKLLPLLRLLRVVPTGPVRSAGATPKLRDRVIARVVELVAHDTTNASGNNRSVR